MTNNGRVKVSTITKHSTI